MPRLDDYDAAATYFGSLLSARKRATYREVDNFPYPTAFYSRPVAGNTLFGYVAESAVRNGVVMYYALVFHGSPIIRWLPDGRVVLNHCGWMTATTWERMNEYMPHARGVGQYQYCWYVFGRKVWVPDDIVPRRPTPRGGKDIIAKPRDYTLMPWGEWIPYAGLRTSNVLALCQAMLDSQTWDRMPILADALEEAGCGDAVLLAACRACDTDNDLVRTLLNPNPK